MPATARFGKILSLVDERGFISVNELSDLLQVSTMTIRRDLNQLVEQQRIQRTYGGAVSIRSRPTDISENDELRFSGKPEGLLVDRVDVLVTSSVTPRYNQLLLERISKRDIPIIAESLPVKGDEVVVAVDNYKAGFDLGCWVGSYIRDHWQSKAVLLDLTYHLANTQTRSRAFLAGLRKVIPSATEALSLNTQSRYETAYQLTKDALTVHEDINIIFAINDISAWGAINACQDRDVDPDQLIVVTFGLEGDTLKDALMKNSYCKAGLAMFPEIVAPVCIEAAIAAHNQQILPHQIITPYMILTPETLPEIYKQGESGWELRWEVVQRELEIPIDLNLNGSHNMERLPRCIGFIVPFIEHEWYQKLRDNMQSYADIFDIEIEIVDVDEDLADEMDLRRREIARQAAELVQPGDVILVGGGPLAEYLAEEFMVRDSLTIITNSVPVFDILRQNPDNILISTGGAYWHSSQGLVGPQAEGALHELRADKLFLMVAGISFDFGLSHTNISEVTIKQAMIRSARQVILLADHTLFGQESIAQVAPLSVVDLLITDDALPASTRLDLTKQGIEVILVAF